MTYYLHIPEASPSRNVFHHKHWRVEHTAKARWEKMILVESRVARVPKATGPRRVLFRRFGKRKLDHDNFIGGLKGPIDCLRKLGLLLDDDEKHASFLFEQHTATACEPHTIIGLEDL